MLLKKQSPVQGEEGEGFNMLQKGEKDALPEVAGCFMYCCRFT